MQQVTIGPKYQIVIPRELRKDFPEIKPGAKVNIYKTKNKTLGIDPNTQSWVERTSGMMTEAWKNTDPIKELEKMREEWEERLEKLEEDIRK